MLRNVLKYIFGFFSIAFLSTIAFVAIGFLIQGIKLKRGDKEFGDTSKGAIIFMSIFVIISILTMIMSVLNRFFGLDFLPIIDLEGPGLNHRI